MAIKHARPPPPAPPARCPRQMSAVLLKALLFSSAAGANAEPVSAAVEHQIADMTPDLLALVELGVRGHVGTVLLAQREVR